MSFLLIVGLVSGAISFALLGVAGIGLLTVAKRSDLALGYDEASEPRLATIDRRVDMPAEQAAYHEALREAGEQMRATPSDAEVAELVDEAEAITWEAAL